MPKAAKAFKKAAKRQDPAVFDYAHEVEQMWHDFPQTKENIVFLDICAPEGQQLVYPEDSEQKKSVLDGMDSDSLKASIRLCRDKWHNSACLPWGEARHLLLYTKKHSHDLIAKNAPVAQETMHAFDHEIGHLIIPGGSYGDGDKNMAECVADAYAVIRHFQRYGADSTVIDSLVQHRAVDIIFRDRWYGQSHFTSPVVEQILARRHEIEWDQLTPLETTRLARQFAMDYAMHHVPLKLMEEDFEPLHGKSAELDKGDASSLPALAEKVLTTDSSNVFKYGTAALKLFLDQQTADIILTGDYWDNVRQKLAEKQQAFDAQEKPLFGIKTKGPASSTGPAV